MADEIRRDPATGETVVVKRGGNTGLIIAILLLLALVALAYFTGLINVGGKLEAPKVSVTGGEVPKVTTGEIVAGTTKQTVDVPKVETTKKEIDVPAIGIKKAPTTNN